MSTPNRPVAIAGFAAVLAVCVALWSCNSDSSGNAVTITPTSATLHFGDSQRFAADGGYEYTWSLAQPSWGTLDRFHGSTVVYTSRHTPPNGDEIQILTVTSTIEGTSNGAGTNGPGDVVTAEAFITHRGAVSTATTTVTTTTSTSTTQPVTTTSSTTTTTTSGPPSTTSPGGGPPPLP